MKKQTMLVGVLVSCVGLLVMTAQEHAGKAEKTVDPKVEKITAAIPETKVKPKQKRTLLVFSRTMGYRHGSIPVGKKALKILGEKSGAYSVVISDDLSNFEKPKIDTFDAICFLNTTLEVFSLKKGQRAKASDAEKEEALERELRLKQNLIEFIANGKGFVGIHAASDTFYKWPEYGNMLGAYFDGHPWRWNTPVVIDVEKGMENHPIIAGMTKQSFNEEIYQFKAPYDSSKLHILTRLNVEESSKKVKLKRTDNDYGTSWYKSHGKGRVFYCSLGHNEHIYWNSNILSHYLAGIQYALGDLELSE